MSGFGISFGNTSAYVALTQNGSSDVIANSAGERSTSTVVACEDGEILTATPALQMQTRQPQNAVSCLKNLIQPEKYHLACKGQACKFEQEKDDVIVNFQNSNQKSAKLLIDAIFQNLKETADSSLGSVKHEAVIAVPYKSTQKYRDMINSCAEDSGFTVVDMVPEHIAALLYYEPDTSSCSSVLVVRVGGQSSDVSLIEVAGGLYSVINYKEEFIGGTKFDKEVGKFLCNDFNKKHHVRIDQNVKSVSKLLKSAKEAKHMLTQCNRCECRVESLYDGIDMVLPLSRPRFETIIQSDLDKLLDTITEATKDYADVSISKVVLCGSGSLVSKLQSLVKERFPQAQILNKAPGEVVAIGCAKHLYSLQKYSPVLSKIELNEDKTVSMPTIAAPVSVMVDEKTSLLVPKGVPLPYQGVHHIKGGNVFSILYGDNTLVEAEIPDCDSELSLQFDFLQNGSLELIVKDDVTGERSVIEVSTN